MNSKGNPDFRFQIGLSRSELSRRHFLRRATGALGMTAAATIGNLAKVRHASAIYTPSDYRALVCIFMRGGADMNNFLIPVGNNDQAAAYKNDRGGAAVPELISEEKTSAGTPANGLPDPNGNQLVDSVERNATYVTSQSTTYANKLPAPSGNHTDFALHSSCFKLKQMFDARELGIICNVATLAQTTTAANYFDPATVLPVQLFSHANQVNEHMSGNAAAPFTSGWAGRIASHYDPVNMTTFDDFYNDSADLSRASMLITIGNGNEWMVTPGGSQVQQYQLTTAGAIDLQFSAGEPEYENITNYNNYRNILHRGYNDKVRTAAANRALIGTAITNADAIPGLNINGIFSGHGATDDLGLELRMVAKLIASRHVVKNTRQIFFVDISGWDHHSSINSAQPPLLSRVSNAVAAFNDALKALDGIAGHAGIYNKVLGFQMSDFNRTWTPNGTVYNALGTDHAWGSTAFCFGGPVKKQTENLNGGAVGSGHFFGYFPKLEIDGPDDVPGSNNRGRWIPTTAVDHYAARCANWFGIPSSDIGQILPNLAPGADAFDDGPFDLASNLDFVEMDPTIV